MNVPQDTIRSPQRLASGAADQDSLAILNAKLETVLAFQDAILGTVWWALGILLAFTLVLIGINWFSAKREREAFERQISQGLDAAKLQLTTEAKEEARNIRESLRTGLQKEQERIRDNLTHGIDKLRHDLIEHKLTTGQDIYPFEIVDLLRIAGEWKESLRAETAIAWAEEFLKKDDFPLLASDARSLEMAIRDYQAAFPIETKRLLDLVAQRQQGGSVGARVIARGRKPPKD